MGFEFEHCCFCIDLRIGCLVIGYINLFADLALILMSGMGLAAAGHVGRIYGGQAAAMGTIMMAILAVTMLVCILFLIFTIVLLVGLHQHKRGHVKAYLIYTLIFVILYTIMFFTGFAIATYSPWSIARDVISIVLTIYFLLVIRSYYLQMDDPNLRPAIYNTA
ncbi:unnamed protein product [Chrysodeixis includens]|uniref:Uncharacterized protein n=1 Tax=Chrysodeixis includens TaxID=689277 RepID=A0A9P0C081_CHRIL|nr:unnamed protein product [Chrysodeixis includens]